MDILHGPVAAAGRYQWVLRLIVYRFFGQTDSADMKICVKRVLSGLDAHIELLLKLV